MKLRYYMRGLGIGILVTALIMGGAGGKQIPLTDAEIKAKAAQLGMVESGSITLSDVQQIQNTNQTFVPEPEAVDEPADSTLNQETQETNKEPAESTIHEEAESKSPETESPEIESIETDSTETESTGKQPESESETEEISKTSITVKAGSGSETVCKQLAKAGLIEDAGEYDKYLVKNGYATRICVGTYEIQTGSSWEEIAKIITRKK